MNENLLTTSKNTVNIAIFNDNDRINKFRYRHQMLNDNFYKQVELELGNVYKKSVELGLMTQIDDTNNLYKMVIEEISKVYDSGIERIFSENETIQESMMTLYEDIDINEILAQSNIYINAFNDVLLQVGVKDGMFNIRLRRPDNTVVKYNSDLELEEVYVYIGEEAGLQKWYGYTDSEMFATLVGRPHELLEDNLQVMPQDGMETTVNNLGFLPFVAVHNGFRDDDFWQMYKGDDLVKGTIQVAIKLTFLNHLIKMQSFKQLVATGSNLRQLDGAVIDPQSILYVDGQDTDIKTLDLESNYKALWETIQSINNNIALNYKISPNMFRLTGTPTSGFGLQMENIKLDGFISKQQKMYKKIESDIFYLLKEIDLKMGLGLIQADDIKVHFEEKHYPMTDEEVAAGQKAQIELGLTNSIEIIMEDRGISKDEATAVYAENIKIRNQMNDNLNQSLNMDTTAEAMGLTDGNA